MTEGSDTRYITVGPKAQPGYSEHLLNDEIARVAVLQQKLADIRELACMSRSNATYGDAVYYAEALDELVNNILAVIDGEPA